MIEFESVNFFRDQAVQDDPYSYFNWVRSQSPVWLEPNYGMFVITGYQEAMAVYSDPATFPENQPASGTFSSCNVVCGSFVKLSTPFEGATSCRSAISSHPLTHRITRPTVTS
jgi:cytochrome P450 family 150 subfamily A5